MKAVLIGINARYAHSNPAIRGLRAYACDPAREFPVPAEDLVLYENHINHPPDRIVRALSGMKADLYGFSCYLWNIERVLRICGDLHRIRPDATIVLGGPEMVGGEDGRAFLSAHPEIDALVTGEGEEAFYQLVSRFSYAAFPKDYLEGCAGWTWRKGGRVLQKAPGAKLDMAELPFLYADGTADLEHRLLYYESSRGCPVGCAYCLSANDRQVRTLPIGRVLKEVSMLAQSCIQTVKFVDRTFNANPARALEIWRHVLSLDTSVTFHFEIAAHLLDEPTLQVLAAMPPARIQLEIGIQSIHQDVLRVVHRDVDTQKTLSRIGDLVRCGNLQVHLDLIAGLPGESLAQFAASFNTAYRLAPGALQPGILKILPGTPMQTMASQSGYCYSPSPPYRVFSSDAMSAEELFLIEDISRLMEVYYNKGAFVSTMAAMVDETSTPFEFYSELAMVWHREGLFDRSVSQEEAAACLLRFPGGNPAKREDCLRHDIERLLDEREWHAYLRRWA